MSKRSTTSLKIQSFLRGQGCRRQYRATKKAIVCLQALVRCHQACTPFLQFRRHENVAQSVVRGHLARVAALQFFDAKAVDTSHCCYLQYRAIKKAIVGLQALVLCHQAYT